MKHLKFNRDGHASIFCLQVGQEQVWWLPLQLLEEVAITLTGLIKNAQQPRANQHRRVTVSSMPNATCIGWHKERNTVAGSSCNR
jgi:hypothetical protein